MSLALLFRRSNEGSLALRALLIAAFGLALGGLDTGIAVILTYYGVLFLLAVPFVPGPGESPVPPRRGVGGRGARGVAGGPAAPARPRVRESLVRLGDRAGPLLAELLFTGYYPAVPWIAYVLLGLALGKSDLRNRGVQAGLVVGGAATALGATLVSRWLTTRDAVAERLLADAPPGQDVDGLLDDIARGMFGQTRPTARGRGCWWSPPTAARPSTSPRR